MGIKSITTYECDRCGNTANSVGEVAKPPRGWAEISISEYVRPASRWQDYWFDYTLLFCEGCMSTILSGAAHKVRSDALSEYASEYDEDDEEDD